MNYTIYFYCDCGFEASLSDGDDYVVGQCQTCRHLQSLPKSISYVLECQACGFEKRMPEEFTLELEEACGQCAIKGKVGFSEFIQKGELFLLKTTVNVGVLCKKCKSSDWANKTGEHIACPMCRRHLQHHASSKWE